MKSLNGRSWIYISDLEGFPNNSERISIMYQMIMAKCREKFKWFNFLLKCEKHLCVCLCGNKKKRREKKGRGKSIHRNMYVELRVCACLCVQWIAEKEWSSKCLVFCFAVLGIGLRVLHLKHSATWAIPLVLGFQLLNLTRSILNITWNVPYLIYIEILAIEDWMYIIEVVKC
jgi:hypothetical protein